MNQDTKTEILKEFDEWFDSQGHPGYIKYNVVTVRNFISKALDRVVEERDREIISAIWRMEDIGTYGSYDNLREGIINVIESLSQAKEEGK